MTRHIFQSTAWYLPFQVGGTEVYLEGLVDGLVRQGFNSEVLLPRPPDAQTSYLHRGVPVSSYPLQSTGAGNDHLAAFATLLKTRPEAIYNQHSWTPDCGPDQLRIARELGLPTILTIHVPSNTCLRGNMMVFDKIACDGKIDEHICAACWAHGRGVPKPAAQILARLPLQLTSRLPQGRGRAFTALRARSIALGKLSDYRAMVENADKIVAVCQWLYDALLLNGAPRDKLVLNRQGVGQDFLESTAVALPAPPRPVRCDAGAPLKLLFLGRWNPVKAIDVVVRALKILPGAPVELAIHGPASPGDEAAYKASVETLIDGDPRITIGDLIARKDIPAAMQAFDAMVIPSTWFETGPLVALEAQAAGLYVLGSRLGGIAELVDTPDKGMLVAEGDPEAWAVAIKQMIAHRPRGLRQVVRTMDEVSQDMAALYRQLD